MNLYTYTNHKPVSTHKQRCIFADNIIEADESYMKLTEIDPKKNPSIGVSIKFDYNGEPKHTEDFIISMKPNFKELLR